MLAVLAVLISASLSGATVAGSQGVDSRAPEPTYSRPAVAPFEPLSDFGRIRAQGDDASERHRRPLTTPTPVDAYRHDYEFSRSDREIGYDQGVAQARIDAQTRMGPLDGVWRVVNTDGDVLSDLVVGDAGADAPLVAAWNIGRASDRRGQTTARRDGQAVVVEVGMGARTARLRLTPSPNGWTGDLSRNGRSQPVVLTRPSDG